MSLSAVAVLPAPRHRGRGVLDVIRSLRQQSPRIGEDRLAELLVDELLDDRELLRAVAGDLVHKALVPAKVRPRATLKAAEAARCQRVARQVAAKAEAQAVAGKVKELVLLDLMMPNGVAMRFCSGTQMAGFGTAYEKIAERAGTAMVGEVMVEAEVKALLQMVV